MDSVSSHEPYGADAPEDPHAFSSASPDIRAASSGERESHIPRESGNSALSHIPAPQLVSRDSNLETNLKGRVNTINSLPPSRDESPRSSEMVTYDEPNTLSVPSVSTTEPPPAPHNMTPAPQLRHANNDRDDEDAIMAMLPPHQGYEPALSWYTYPASVAFHLTNHANERFSKKNGLTVPQADLNGRELGTNYIPVKGGPNPLRIFIGQFVNSITVILLIVAIIGAVFEDWVEFGVVMAIIVLNGVLGFYQEYSAALSLDALKKMTSGTAKVLRDGQVLVVEPSELVVGDVVILDQGDEVPADIRLYEVSNDLAINEALLTGEAEPVAKRVEAIPDPDGKCALGDRKNMAYRSTNLVSGRGRGLVVAAGLHTEMGKLADRLGEAESTRTPLMIKMDIMLYILFGCCAILAVIVFAADKMRWSEKNLMYACAVAIAILPESLVLVLTVAMTLSIRRMAQEKCIVRKLGVLEVLGGITDICSDKTGTLTENKMAVKVAFVGVLKSYSVHGAIRGCDGHFIERPAGSSTYVVATPQMSSSPTPMSGNRPAFTNQPSTNTNASFRGREKSNRLNVEAANAMYQEFFRAAALCSAVRMHINPEDESELIAEGNPTEIAIQTMAWKADREPEFFEAHELAERIGEYPFNSSVKRMTTVYRLCPGRRESTTDGDAASDATSSAVVYSFTKGAPERILDLCQWQIDQDGVIKPLTADDRTILTKNIAGMASYGLRTICFARRHVGEHPYTKLPDPGDEDGPAFDKLNPREEVEDKLVYLGLVGIQDPPRKESGPSVLICQHAGIKVRMLTGDHGDTAAAIADNLGILQTFEDRSNPQKVMIGPDFDKMDDAAVDAMEDLPAVIGRCSPESKVKMIEALHRRGRVVAMTGDGFNDSPSIKKADVGCAMGSGTDVTKGVADIVITDDNFRTIVKAVREGRRIAEVIKHFVIHLLTSNVAEVIALIVGLCVRHEDRSVFILSPLQILWLNMVTSSPPAIGLSMDDVDDDILEQPPNTKGLFTAELITDFMVSGVIMGACCLCSFVFVGYGGNDGLSGTDCNSHEGVGCDVIWTARATAFSVLYCSLLLHAYNVRHPRKSIVQIRWFDNPIIYLNVLFGVACLMICLYVEVIAKNVFIHKYITWEWGVVGVALVVFQSLYELYKYCKRWIFPLPVVELDQVVEDRTHFVVSSFAGTPMGGTPMSFARNNTTGSLGGHAESAIPPALLSHRPPGDVGSFRYPNNNTFSSTAGTYHLNVPPRAGSNSPSSESGVLSPQTLEEREAYRRMVRETLDVTPSVGYDARSTEQIARENLVTSFASQRQKTNQGTDRV